MNKMEDRYMDEIRADMEREKKFQDFRHGMMCFCFGGGLVATIASPDWKQMIAALVVTAVAEIVLWMEA